MKYVIFTLALSWLVRPLNLLSGTDTNNKPPPEDKGAAAGSKASKDSAQRLAIWNRTN